MTLLNKLNILIVYMFFYIYQHQHDDDEKTILRVKKTQKPILFWIK